MRAIPGINESPGPEAVRLEGGAAGGDEVLDGSGGGDHKYKTIMTMATATKIM